jgi:hypothetical protein
MKKADIEKSQAKPSKTAKELDESYLNDVEAINKTYASQKQAAGMEKIKQLSSIMGNRIFYQDPKDFEADKKSLEDKYSEYIDSLAKAQEEELKGLDDRYSELPRAKMSQRRRGALAPPPPPPPPPDSSKKITTAGTKKRKELPAGSDIRVTADGKRLVKIGGVIYEVID